MTADRETAAAPEPTAGREALATLAVGLVALLACAFLEAWHPGFFWHDDCQLTMVPVFVEVHRAIMAGELPLLVPTAWASTAFAAEYTVGLFSPIVVPMMVAAVALATTMPGMAAIYGSGMLALTAMGGFRLGRGEGLPPALAALVAAVAAFNGWNVAWAATNWTPAIGSFAALLWAWWALTAAARPGAGPGRVALAGAMVALMVMAGWPHTVFGTALVTAWIALRALVTDRSPRALGPLVLAWAIGAGLSAPAWATFLEYLGTTHRAQVSGLQWEWIVPPAALTGLALPALVTKWTTFGTEQFHLPIELANGLVPTAALAAAIATARRGLAARVAWPLGLALALLVLSCMPSVGMFRWSFRWLPLFHVAAVLAAAHWLHARLAATRPATGLGEPGLWAVGLVLACAALAAAHPVLPWSLALAYLAAAGAWAALDRQLPAAHAARRWAPAGAAAAALLATYMIVPTNIAVPQWRMVEAIRQPAPLDPAVRYVALANGEDYWVDGQARPAWGMALRPGNTPLLAGLEFLNGYTPLHPSGFERAFPSDNHGFWLPIGIDRTARLRAGPHGLLARLGFDGLVVSPRVRGYVPIVAARGWTVVAETPDGTILHRKGPPSARVHAYEGARVAAFEDTQAFLDALDAPDGLPLIAPTPERPAGAMPRYGARALRLDRYDRHAMAVEVGPGDRPALVAIRRMWVPGWQATLAGQALPVLALDGLAIAVEAPAGVSGRLELVYRPAGLVKGVALALATLALTLLGWAWARRRRARAGAA